MADGGLRVRDQGLYGGAESSGHFLISGFHHRGHKEHRERKTIVKTAGPDNKLAFNPVLRVLCALCGESFFLISNNPSSWGRLPPRALDAVPAGRPHWWSRRPS